MVTYDLILRRATNLRHRSGRIILGFESFRSPADRWLLKMQKLVFTNAIMPVEQYEEVLDGMKKVELMREAQLHSVGSHGKKDEIRDRIKAKIKEDLKSWREPKSDQASDSSQKAASS